ncbi:hypothetical protein PspLS_10076 [Pyricularia sp. CBS 133598]|nr:hypothetical protein PspLS_10076 [Pyricularia sp. CBS 133598]
MELFIRTDRENEIIFVFANRYSSESDVLYIGFLTVTGICNGKVKIYGVFSRGTKQLFVIDTDKKPSARFLKRPGKKATDDSCDTVHDNLFGLVGTVKKLAIPYNSRNICPTNEIDTRELALIYIPENTVEIFTNISKNIRPKSLKNQVFGLYTNPNAYSQPIVSL